MRTVLVIAFSDLANDPRVNRQLRCLAGRYRVIAAGFADPGIAGVTFIPIVPQPRGALRKLRGAITLACRLVEPYYWQKPIIQAAFQQLSAVRADLIIANDLITLPLARRLANGARIILDAHEYAPLEWEDQFFWNLLMRPISTSLCRTHIPHVDAMTTVCQGIAQAYDDLTGVRPTVVTNAPEYHALSPRPYRESERPIQLVHHGILARSRRLENMILMMDHLDSRFELNFALAGDDPTYHARLVAMARSRPSIRFVPPVPMRTLPVFLNQFDLGVFLLEPVNFNYRHALPNKLFEFIQARLGVAIGPSPEMARVVTTAGCGMVAPDFRPATLAACLRGLGEREINAFKERAHAAAPALSAQANESMLLALVERVLGQPSVRRAGAA